MGERDGDGRFIRSTPRAWTTSKTADKQLRTIRRGPVSGLRYRFAVSSRARCRGRLAGNLSVAYLSAEVPSNGGDVGVIRADQDNTPRHRRSVPHLAKCGTCHAYSARLSGGWRGPHRCDVRRTYRRWEEPPVQHGFSGGGIRRPPTCRRDYAQFEADQTWRRRVARSLVLHELATLVASTVRNKQPRQLCHPECRRGRWPQDCGGCTDGVLRPDA